MCHHTPMTNGMSAKSIGTFSDWLIDINYTISLEIVDNFYTDILCKYHWVSVNSFWPSGPRPSLCDVHNSLNTDPLLLLSVGGHANSVKSKIISSPINNQLQDCCLSDRAEKPRGGCNRKWKGSAGGFSGSSGCYGLSASPGDLIALA